MIKAMLAAVSFFLLTGFAQIEKAMDTVVTLATVDHEQKFCSGTVVDHMEGLILTAFHCIADFRDNQTEKVELPNGEVQLRTKTIWHPVRVMQTRTDLYGNEWMRLNVIGSIVKYNVAVDMALIKVKPQVFNTSAKINDYPVKYLDKVWHFGMPIGISQTVSEGIITKPRLTEPLRDAAHIPVDAIVFSSYINRGSSGGPLFNEQGELIGVTNWGLPGGPYLASRIKHAVELIDRYKKATYPQ